MNSVSNKSAWIFAVSGTFLTLLLTRSELSESWQRALELVGISNFAGFTALMMTVQLEVVPVVKKRLLNSTLRTWILMSAIYFSILLGFSPELRSLYHLTIFFLPLLLSTGFMMMVFGPLQDQIVGWRWRKRKEKKSCKRSRKGTLERGWDLHRPTSSPLR